MREPSSIMKIEHKTKRHIAVKEQKKSGSVCNYENKA